MTCDSDGKIDHFVSVRHFSPHLPVHSISGKKPYYIGVFLVGAYQEILGDLHNLFGDTNAIHIHTGKDDYEITQVIDGESVAEVLDYVQFDAKKLVRNLEKRVSSAIARGAISAHEGKEFLANYRSGLYGYTYLEK